MRLASVLMSEIRLHKAMSSYLEAATLIITAPSKENVNLNLIDKTTCDYGVLMLKRSSKSSFYPNAYVFPGGRTDKADFSEKWISVYKEFDSNCKSLFDRLKITQDDNNRSPMFNSNENDCIHKEVAFRICAIRETFEETGILLARNLDNKNFTSRYSDIHQFDNNEVLQEWRDRVHNDAFKFVDLCKEFKCVPDIWSLHEWSNWLTPSEMFQKMSKRFDTVFYTASIPSAPQFAEQDNTETVAMTWETPQTNLEVFRNKKGIYGPPQVYELQRMANFKSHHQFAEFSHERGSKGMERWLPVRAWTKDKVNLSLYPGDQFYPKHIDKNTIVAGPIDIGMTYSEMLNTPPFLQHHMRFYGSPFELDIVCSYPALYGHCNPQSTKLFNGTKPKL